MRDSFGPEIILEGLLWTFQRRALWSREGRGLCFSALKVNLADNGHQWPISHGLPFGSSRAVRPASAVRKKKKSISKSGLWKSLHKVFGIIRRDPKTVLVSLTITRIPDRILRTGTKVTCLFGSLLMTSLCSVTDDPQSVRSNNVPLFPNPYLLWIRVTNRVLAVIAYGSNLTCFRIVRFPQLYSSDTKVLMCNQGIKVWNQAQAGPDANNSPTLLLPLSTTITHSELHLELIHTRGASEKEGQHSNQGPRSGSPCRSGPSSNFANNSWHLRQQLLFPPACYQERMRASKAWSILLAWEREANQGRAHSTLPSAVGAAAVEPVCNGIKKWWAVCLHPLHQKCWFRQVLVPLFRVQANHVLTNDFSSPLNFVIKSAGICLVTLQKFNLITWLPHVCTRLSCGPEHWVHCAWWFSKTFLRILKSGVLFEIGMQDDTYLLSEMIKFTQTCILWQGAKIQRDTDTHCWACCQLMKSWHTWEILSNSQQTHCEESNF